MLMGKTAKIMYKNRLNPAFIVKSLDFIENIAALKQSKILILLCNLSNSLVREIY